MFISRVCRANEFSRLLTMRDQLLGFVTSGDLSHMRGCGFGTGFVSLSALGAMVPLPSQLGKGMVRSKLNRVFIERAEELKKEQNDGQKSCSEVKNNAAYLAMMWCAKSSKQRLVKLTVKLF